MTKNKRETILGIPPIETLNFGDKFHVYKSSKPGQNSFRITKSLLETVLKKAGDIGKIPNLIITITDDSDIYSINCSITKSQK